MITALALKLQKWDVSSWSIISACVSSLCQLPASTRKKHFPALQKCSRRQTLTLSCQLSSTKAQKRGQQNEIINFRELKWYFLHFFYQNRNSHKKYGSIDIFFIKMTKKKRKILTWKSHLEYVDYLLSKHCLLSTLVIQRSLFIHTTFFEQDIELCRRKPWALGCPHVQVPILTFPSLG